MTIYLSVCLFLLSPSPLQLSCSLQKPLTPPPQPPHVIPIRTANFTLADLLQLSQHKTKKCGFKADQITREHSVAMKTGKKSLS